MTMPGESPSQTPVEDALEDATGLRLMVLPLTYEPVVLRIVANGSNGHTNVHA